MSNVGIHSIHKQQNNLVMPDLEEMSGTLFGGAFTVAVVVPV